MRIMLRFPTASETNIKAMGLRQRNPEKLHWTTDHAASHYGCGVILRGKSGEILDGRGFAALVSAFGAWIEVDSRDAKRRVENALVTAATQLDDAVVVVDAGAK